MSSSRVPGGELLSVYLKGFFMGAADTVPGVSGGTIALITGIYERLITAITEFDLGVVQNVFRLHTAEGRAAFREDLLRMDVFFLAALGAGILTAIITLSRIVEAALHNYPAFTFAFFFGLIAASAIVLYRHVNVATPGRLAVGVAGFTFAFLISGASSSGGLPNSLPFAFVAGAIAITAMILPGISGSFLLLLMGQYQFMLGTLRAFVDGLINVARGGAIDPVVEPATTVVVFGVGAVVGLLTIAHVIRWALSNYRAATLTFLVSLMVGALRLPAEEVLANGTFDSAVSVATVVVIAVVGGAAVLMLDWYTDDLEYA
ncbi:DUF368 domain-containing protein [Haladaptatus sp. DYSN1]|uniref:DUF368 domain-containing protein n=1 Tax=unclassified Haladaptatus TaxID=2622732 RepID=UPI002405AE5F|nr:DUF368 domain-containing protein [Haladaptatus sp. DYSN1]